MIFLLNLNRLISSNCNNISFFQFFRFQRTILSCSMFCSKFQIRVDFFSKIAKNDIIAMIIYFRCVRFQKKCRLSFLSQKYVECIRTEKKCKFAKLAINFVNIDKILEKLKRKKLKTKIAWKIIIKFVRTKQSKLKRLRQQKRFLKKREQKMFEKNCSMLKNSSV